MVKVEPKYKKTKCESGRLKAKCKKSELLKLILRVLIELAEMQHTVKTARLPMADVTICQFSAGAKTLQKTDNMMVLCA